MLYVGTVLQYLSTDYDSPYEYNIREGQPSFVECGQAQSPFPINTNWSFTVNRTTLKAFPGSLEILASGKLFLTEPDPSVAGIYICQFELSSLGKPINPMTGFIKINILCKYSSNK